MCFYVSCLFIYFSTSLEDHIFIYVYIHYIFAYLYKNALYPFLFPFFSSSLHIHTSHHTTVLYLTHGKLFSEGKNRKECYRSLEGSVCLHMSKPKEKGPGVCSKESRGSFKEMALSPETQVS